MSKINNFTNIENTKYYNSSSVKNSSENCSDFSSFLGETKTLDGIFDQAAGQYNVPVELLKAVGKAESDFNSKAVSRCGAQGIMQLMPSTAKGLGVSDSFDAQQNIMGGAKYLSGLLQKYNGNKGLALAAYNAGSGNVKKYGGIPPFEETQNYVKKVLNYMNQGNIEISEENNSLAGSVDNSSRAEHFFRLSTPTQVTSNYGYLLSNANNSITGASPDNLDALFSYDDYLQFLDLFLEEEKNNKNGNTASTSKDIAYNEPVLNLLSEHQIS
jgi:Soluble lytic murein transglycosylase and related regulatory proteins (some contain LysM/invasin domains)